VELEEKAPKSQKAAFYLCLLLVMGIILLIPILQNSDFIKEEGDKVAFTTEFNNLTISIDDPFLSTNSDTGKVIINVPVNLKNNGEYSYTFRPVHTYYNDKLVFSLFNVDDNEIDKKIKSGEELSGTIYVKLDTRDLESVKTFRSIFSVYDFYTEDDKEIDVTLNVIK
jgi:hypothetical protein